MSKKLIILILILAAFVSLFACDTAPAKTETPAPDTPFVSETPPSAPETPHEKSTGQIYLYGEYHGVEKIIDKEYELWYNHYNNDKMRHLFIELPYYTAEFLNIWMQSDSDDILNEIYRDWQGTAMQVPHIKEFYKQIKNECPETVFHGTDVGHQWDTTGKRYLQYLKDSSLTDTEQYLLTQEAIEQGRYYYTNRENGNVYRENTMTENFIREFDRLGEDIIGIYGSAHTGLDASDFSTASVPCMANQLKERYGDAVHSEDLSWMVKDIEPLRTDTITVDGKDYEALYYGREDLTGFKDYSYRDFWRLENAYDDFKDAPKPGYVLPYDEYPMLIEECQVYVIDYTVTDGSVVREYHISDGLSWNGTPATMEFTVD